MINLTNYLEGISFSTFNFWFTRISLNIFRIMKLGDDRKFYEIGTLYDDENNLEIRILSSCNESEDAIAADFNRYKFRPEYTVGRPIDWNRCEEAYDKLLIGCHLIRAFRLSFSDPDDYLNPVHRAIEWLSTTDFYTAPGSSRYHDNEPKGLLKHSLRVALKMVDLNMLPDFKSVKLEDAVLAGLVHDWCKIGLYESYDRNVKDDAGKWVTKKEYRTKQAPLTCFGHGVSSMFLANRFFRFDVDASLAIRWHMGFCRVADSDMNELQQANETYPIVHMLQFADQLSITKYNKD